MESVLDEKPLQAAARPTATAVAPHTWPVPVLVFAGACITFGILWDISWHSTIGRDTFWTPPHLLIYLGGTLGGLVAGWLAFSDTVSNREAAVGRSVGIFGARAPLGAWVTLWGAAAMLTSAPLDDWWHNAYGLDVKILSPPHALLAAGMYGVVTGAVLLASAARNRGGGKGTAGLAGLVIIAQGIQLALASILLTELSFPNRQHTGTFYLASAALYPAFLVAAAWLASVRWAATRVALVYSAIIALMVWVLPWFPAEPQLAPVFNRVNRMVPPAFPLLLVVPALGIDLVFQALRRRTHWGWGMLKVGLAALVFVAVFIPVQWYFSQFLISPAADHALFAGHGRFMGYMARREEWQGVFWRVDRDPFTTLTAAKMLVLALVSAAVGAAAGTFLHRVRR